MSGTFLKDKDWIRQCFLVPASKLEPVDLQNRTFTTASLKFTDTTLGGNIAINPPPQFTEYADLPPATLSRRPGGNTMGRYYSEAIDDNAQIINIRFGVPEFNSTTTFFANFYNTNAGKLARTGRSNTAFYLLGRAAGAVVGLMSWKLLAVHLIGMGYRFFLNKPSSRFYYLKPTMPLYWNAVQTIVNHIAVNKGIVPRLGTKTTNEGEKNLGDNYQFDDAARKQMHALMPDIFDEGGQINVYAVANRAQRLARRQEAYIQQTVAEATSGINKAVQQAYTQSLSDKAPNYLKYLESWYKSGPGVEKVPQSPAAPTDTTAPAADKAKTDTTTTNGQTSGDSSASAPPTPPSTASTDGTVETAPDFNDRGDGEPGFLEFLKSEWDDGAAFISLRVNSTGAVGESFSNTTTPSEIQNKMNSMSSSSRNVDFAAGGIGNVPIVGQALGAIKDFASGVLDSMQLSGLAVLGGAAFVDIPEHWESSVAQAPRMSYTMNLQTPYGNPISQMINLWIPYAMILAGALPLATGKQSYTSPFICEIYDKGRAQSRLAILDSLSVTRGTGNTGFNNNGEALGMEVSFTFKDLSNVISMPVSEGFDLGAAVVDSVAGFVAAGVVGAVGAGFLGMGIFDDENAFTDYMAVCGSMGLVDQIYGWRKFKMNLTKIYTNFSTFNSAAHYASFAGDLLPSRIVSAFYRGTAR